MLPSQSSTFSRNSLSDAGAHALAGALAEHGVSVQATAPARSLCARAQLQGCLKGLEARPLVLEPQENARLELVLI